MEKDQKIEKARSIIRRARYITEFDNRSQQHQPGFKQRKCYLMLVGDRAIIAKYVNSIRTLARKFQADEYVHVSVDQCNKLQNYRKFWSGHEISYK